MVWVRERWKEGLLPGLTVLLVPAMLAVGCATSHRIVHHRGAYFEHCHAADYDPARTDRDRQRCWTAWLTHHSEGGAPDRISFAQRRLDELGAGESPRALPGMEPQRASFTTFTALSTRETRDNAAARAATAQPPDAAPQESPDTATPPAAYGRPCQAVCAPRHAACATACERYGTQCHSACRVELRLCLRGCH